MKPYKAIHKTKVSSEHPEAIVLSWKELREVTVLAVSGKWAMVRRPRSVPYICPLKELVEQ